MKKILKQVTSWVGVGCLLTALTIAVVGCIFHQSSSLINALQKAINENNINSIAECFAPDMREKFFWDSSLDSSMYDGLSGRMEIYFAGYEEEEEENLSETEETNKKIRCIFVEKSGVDIDNVYSTYMEVIEIDNKEYIKY